MNSLVKSAHRVLQSCVKSPSLTSALVTRAQAPVKRDFTRGIWHMSSKSLNGTPAATGLLHNHSNTCSCGCRLKALHTKGTLTPSYQNFEVMIAPCPNHNLFSYS